MGKDIQTVDQLISEIKLLFNSRQKAVIFALCFLGALALAWWGILPQWQNFQENRDDLIATEADLESLEDKKANLEKALSQVNEDDITLVNDTLYSSKPFLEILYALAAARTEFPVTFTQLNFSPGEVATASATTARRRSNQEEKLTLNLNINGEHNNVMSFLHRVETMRPITNITNLDLSKRDDGNSSARLELETYYYSQSVSPNINTAIPVLNSQDKEMLAQLREWSNLDADQLNQNELISSGVDNLFGFTQIDLENYTQELEDALEHSETVNLIGTDADIIPPADTPSGT